MVQSCKKNYTKLGKYNERPYQLCERTHQVRQASTRLNEEYMKQMKKPFRDGLPSGIQLNTKLNDIKFQIRTLEHKLDSTKLLLRTSVNRAPLPPPKEGILLTARNVDRYDEPNMVHPLYQHDNYEN